MSYQHLKKKKNQSPRDNETASESVAGGAQAHLPQGACYLEGVPGALLFFFPFSATRPYGGAWGSPGPHPGMGQNWPGLLKRTVQRLEVR